MVRTQFSIIFSILILTSCVDSEPAPTQLTTDQSPPLAYTIVAREDISFAGTPRMVYRVVFDVDQIPSEESIRQTSSNIWLNNNTHWKEFTVFGFLPEMETDSVAYSVGEFTPDGLKEFRVQDSSLLETKWDEQPEIVKPDPDAGIVSDEFELRWELEKDVLLLAIDTDLPDEAELSVSVSRIYYQVGNNEAYSRNYLSVFEPVSVWRNPRSIPLDPNKWKADLQQHQSRLNGIEGLGFEVDRIEDAIQIRALLHANQSDPRFGGRGNPNLSGDASSSGNLISVEASATVEFPLD